MLRTLSKILFCAHLILQGFVAALFVTLASILLIFELAMANFDYLNSVDWPLYVFGLIAVSTHATILNLIYKKKTATRKWVAISALSTNMLLAMLPFASNEVSVWDRETFFLYGSILSCNIIMLLGMAVRPIHDYIFRNPTPKDGNPAGFDQ